MAALCPRACIAVEIPGLGNCHAEMGTPAFDFEAGWTWQTQQKRW